MADTQAKPFRIGRAAKPPTRIRNTYPFRTMQVGDSFTIPKDRIPCGSFHGNAQRYGIKIATKRLPNGALRVWRIA